VLAKESPKPAVQTNVFSNPAARGTVRPPPQEVQTGGFGNPSGIELPAAAGGTDKIPQIGSFDAAEGPGRGNGTGGRKGVQGTIASAGFGNGLVSPDGARASKDGSGWGTVRSGGFGDYGDPGGAEASSHGTRAASPNISPVEIVYKPKPVYSQKAREMKLEGEVLVEVMFKASGQIQVLRLVQGLGNGLDEEGMRAAQLIRFKPAQQDGKSVDSRAIVHIIFRLS
jgi:TonB family protein